jgi:hypothetical protein
MVESSGSIIPPPMPCTMRNAIRLPADQATPQSTEPARKSATWARLDGGDGLGHRAIVLTGDENAMSSLGCYPGVWQTASMLLPSGSST